MAAAVTIVGLGETWLARWDEITYAECFAAVGASALLWWTSLVVRLGSRSPAAEIAADARHVRPRCHHCGYTITGLPVRGGCPECGSEVAPFLPDNRLAPAWKERKRVGRLRAFWRTIRAVVCDREFFRRLAIHRGAADALSFAFAASLAAAALCLVAAAVALVPHVADWEGATRVVVDSLVAGGLVAALVFWPMLSVVSIVSRACRRSPTAVLIAGCYATALAIPAAGVLSIAVLTPRIGIWAIMTRMTYRNVGGPLIGEGHFDILDILDFRIFASSLLVLAAVVFAAYRAVRGMREVRFAGW
jgi:hypothetical protein